MRWRLVLFALTLLAGCATSRPSPLEIPLQRAPDGRIFVDVAVGAAGPFPFMVDTGASVTILDVTLVQELGLEATGQVVTVHGVAASATAPVFEALPISLGGEDLSPPWVVALDLSHLRAVQGARGVIGVDILSQRVVEIDGDEGMLRLGRAPYTPPNALIVTRTDLVMDAHGLPHVRATINNVEGLALIDTGLAGMILDPAFAERARVPSNGGPMELVDVLSEATATPRSGRARLAVGDARWTIQRIALLRPPVLDALDAGAPTEAILGAGVFADATLVLDFGMRRVFIVDRPTGPGLGHQ